MQKRVLFGWEKACFKIKFLLLQVGMFPFAKELPARHYSLQPCSCGNTKEAIGCIPEHPEWRLSLQTHKSVNVRWRMGKTLKRLSGLS